MRVRTNDIKGCDPRNREASPAHKGDAATQRREFGPTRTGHSQETLRRRLLITHEHPAERGLALQKGTGGF